MPSALRSRQLTPSKSGANAPAAASDSPPDLSMSPSDLRRSSRLSSSKGKEVAEVAEVAEVEEQQLPDYVSDSIDEDPTPTKKLKFDADDKGKAIAVDSDDEEVEQNIALLASRFSRLEKGKGIATVDLDLKIGERVFPAKEPPPPVLNPVFNPAPFAILQSVEERRLERRLKRDKDLAKENALRFARAGSFERVEDEADPDPDPDTEPEPVEEEDWPGPHSTGIKIVRNRRQVIGLDKSGAPKVDWKPNGDNVKGSSVKRMAPSLQDLCMEVLVNNFDAITSLEFIPDAIRHKLVSKLCDTRKMTAGILPLIFQGSPSEVCITDCSWIEEEELKSSVGACNTENLAVLQLNQCGRCFPDYIVLETLAVKGLPALTTLSLKGACRLSDDGLKALISSAPAIKSLNLSQCSLITDAGVNTVADSLRSGLHELYLDDCQTLNVMLILPALQRLENLEVLSLAGIPSVSDKFLKQLVGSIGQNIKELALANCIKLTDASLREISKNCCKLYVLDLVSVTKLTDSGLGYLANCCQAIQSLKLCGNPFSDEAIAALLEACGESLKELSLNRVNQVGAHTAISIAKRCKNLVELDISWCRSLTDECLGLIADSCKELRMLKVFGCTQITSTFLAGHSNDQLLVIGIQLTAILKNPKKQDQLLCPLRYSAS